MVNSISSYTSLTLSQKSLTNTTSLPKKKKKNFNFPFPSFPFLLVPTFSLQPIRTHILMQPKKKKNSTKRYTQIY